MGERELIGLIGLGVMFGLLVLRAPVGLAMILIGVGGNYVLSLYVPFLRFEPYMKQFKSLLWNSMANYELSVVPLFILMGYMASHANLSRDLFQGMNALLGRFRGGVGMAAIGACAGFGAVCGSSIATASTMGKVALPELKRLHYSGRLSTGTLAAGGTLGILIPPSVALVIYAIIVEASIIEMFQAAVIPGLLAVFFFVFVIFLMVRIDPKSAPETEHFSASEKRIALRRMIPVVVIFGSIIVGLGLGLFAPTPAAAVGVFLIMMYGFYLKIKTGQGLDKVGLKSSILDTATTAGMIYFIIFGAEVLKTFFTRSGLPAALAGWISTSGLDPWTLLIIMLFALIVLGCFMDSLAMILVVVPFLWPALVELNGGDYITAEAAAFGMNFENLKLWFGILALIVIELGLITPPVGLNVFIINMLAKNVPMSETFLGVIPFMGIEVVRIGLILVLPALALYLPRLLSG